MFLALEDVNLRKPEPKDGEALYSQKNDPEVASRLGGFALGYSRADIAEWIERHRKTGNEIIWTIARRSDDACLGHVGLYNIDQRVRIAEFAIMIGDASARGHGLGTRVTRKVLDYGFDMLNLNRIELSFLSNNEPARRLYEGLGFVHEGVKRQAQFKLGQPIDVVLMSLLASERSR
jgi:RimJ/RimL family protein N-acetyltransferase